MPQGVTTRPRVGREEARERIITAATGLVRERSFAELTVGEIMDRAGLERTVFYRHFDNVGALLLTAGRRAVDEMYEAQAAIAASNRPLDPAATQEALTVAAEVFHEHGPLLRAIFEAVASGQLAAVDPDALRQRFDGLVAAALRDLEANGGRHFADVGETARAVNLLNQNYLLDAFGGEPRVTVETAARTLGEIWTALVESR